MFERILQMMLKEFIQIFRDFRLRTVVLFMPILQTIIFGYAINIDVHNVKLAVLDLDHSAASRSLVDALVRSGYFTLAATLTHSQQVHEVLDNGTAAVAMQINAGLDQALADGRSGEVLILIDGTDANTASIVRSYIARITKQYAQHQGHDLINQEEPVLHNRAWFNDNLISRNFYIPGVIAILITLVTLTLTSMSIVREKEIGTMEQLIVTPITRVEFVAGKTFPYILIGLFQIICILLVSAYWFQVPIRGNLLLLFFAVSLYLLTTLGLGLFVSTISNTQQEAMLSAFMFYFPLVLLSGFIFPVNNMPEPIQWLTVINPLKYFLVIIRGIFLKGIGINVLWQELLALALIGSVIFWQATRRFHKTLSLIALTALLCGSLEADEPQIETDLSLQSCLHIALDSSPMTRAAQEGVRVAQGEVDKAQAAFYPSMAARIHYNRFQTHAFLPTSPLFDLVPTFIGPTDDWQGVFTGRYLLFDSGRSRALLESAAALRAQACEEAQRIFQEIAMRVSVAYYSVAAQQEICSVSELLLERALAHLHLATQRQEVGAIPKSDLLRVEVEVAEARQIYTKAESDLLIAIGNLNIAMGLPPETQLSIAPEVGQVQDLNEEDFMEAASTAIDLRPELLAAQQRLRALCKQITAARGSLGPRVTAEGMYGYRDIMFPPRDKDWLLGLSLEWPITFGADALIGGVRAQWCKAQAEYEQLELQIRQQVWEAYSRLKTAYENIQTSSTRLENARESARLIEERYEADAATTSDLLDAQASLTRAEGAFVEAQWTYRTSEAMFLWSQGLIIGE